jgi:hypothetical protein
MPDDLEVAKLKKLAKLRSLREAMSLNPTAPKDDELQDFPMELTLSNWTKLFTAGKNLKSNRRNSK